MAENIHIELDLTPWQAARLITAVKHDYSVVRVKLITNHERPSIIAMTLADHQLMYDRIYQQFLQHFRDNPGNGV